MPRSQPCYWSEALVIWVPLNVGLLFGGPRVDLVHDVQPRALDKMRGSLVSY